MYIARIVLALGFMASASLSNAADGLITLHSPYSAEQTLQRLEQQVVQRNLNVFARIDHAAGAAKVGRMLRPTVLLVFGNPRGGTPFMRCEQTVGIDLPLKVLVWVDATGQVRIGYNDPAFIARRHGVENCPVVDKLARALDAITTATVAE
jgi:uncharacterized protein (DUF302 family)